MCHKPVFLLSNEIDDVLLLFPCVEPRVNLCLVVCHEEFTRGKREETLLLLGFFFFFTYKYSNYNAFVQICQQSSDCSHVELLFTHLATKEHHLCIIICVFLKC